jgi:hypothetical protein
MGTSHTAQEDHAAMTSASQTGLLVPGEIVIELHHALLTGRRLRWEIILERLPPRVLTVLNRDIVGRIARVTARRKLLQTVGMQPQVPELTITDPACRLLAIRLLTEYQRINARHLANPRATNRERWEASKRAHLLSDWLLDPGKPLAGHRAQ